eukprot:scaffold110107_cov69-Phaeocystis_antarctica.AAC.2
MADAKAADAEKQIEALRAEMDAMHDIMAGGCCPINSRGDKDIYGRKFSLPVNKPAHNSSSSSSRSRISEQPNTYRPRVVHRLTLSTRPRPSMSSRSPSRTCAPSTRRGSTSSQGS